MHNQYSRGSSLIHWVRHDAQYIVSQVRARAAVAQPGAGTSDDNPGERPVSTDDRDGTQLARLALQALVSPATATPAP
jgi:hypothetical protein